MNNNEVERFIGDLELVSSLKSQIVNQIRAYFQAAETDIEERIIYGGVGFFIEGKHFGGAYPNKHHVNLAFSRGVEFADPDALLQGKGKFRRHLQLFTVEELAQKDAQNFIQQSIQLQLSA